LDRCFVPQLMVSPPPPFRTWGCAYPPGLSPDPSRDLVSRFGVENFLLAHKVTPFHAVRPHVTFFFPLKTPPVRVAVLTHEKSLLVFPEGHALLPPDWDFWVIVFVFSFQMFPPSTYQSFPPCNHGSFADFLLAVSGTPSPLMFPISLSWKRADLVGPHAPGFLLLGFFS